MSFADYVTNIGFRFIKPHHCVPLPGSFYFRRLEKLAKTGSPGWPERFGAWFERVNTLLPEEDAAMKERLRDVCLIPKMSTLAVGALINRGVAEMQTGRAFVNVGVWFGFTFFSGILGNPDKKCVGVDNFSEFGGPRESFLRRFDEYKSADHRFYDTNYIEYFRHVHQGAIGFYIYDGSHDYENQLRGLEVAEPYFSDGCIVLVDDTNWEEPRQATLDFIARSRLDYRILLDLRTNYNCHPTVWNGIMVFQRNA